MKKILSCVLAMAMIIAVMMPVSAATDDFVGSIEGKQAPTVLEQTDANGNQVGAIVYDSNGNQTASIPHSSVIITPLSGANGASDDIANALNNAYNQILQSPNLGDLCPELVQELTERNSDLKPNDLIVRDLFDVRTDDQYANLFNGENTVTVRFNLNIGKDDLLIALQNFNGVWGTLNYRVISGDSQHCIVEIDMKNAGPVAFLSDSGKVVTDKDNPGEASPTTGESFPVLWVTVGSVLLMGAIVSFVLYAKKRTA